jgi:hypothetical protein
MTHGLPAGVKVHPVLTDMHITPARPIRRNVDEPHLFGAREPSIWDSREALRMCALLAQNDPYGCDHRR